MDCPFDYNDRYVCRTVCLYLKKFENLLSFVAKVSWSQHDQINHKLYIAHIFILIKLIVQIIPKDCNSLLHQSKEILKHAKIIFPTLEQPTLYLMAITSIINFFYLCVLYQLFKMLVL